MVQIARSFHAAGHRVILVENHKYWLTGHRFSNAVERFVPDPRWLYSSTAGDREKRSIDIYVPYAVQFLATTTLLSNQCCQAVARCFTSMLTSRKCSMTNSPSARRLAYLFLNPSYYRSQQVLDFDFSNEKRKYILKVFLTTRAPLKHD